MNLLRRILTGEFDYSVPLLVEEPEVLPPAPPPLFLPVEPSVADWRRVNELLDHVHGCRCSTCILAAGLGSIIRAQEPHRAV